MYLVMISILFASGGAFAVTPTGQGCPELRVGADVRIRPFATGRADDHAAFRDLNLEYLEGYAHAAGVIPRLLEPQDFVVLDHPLENVINKGGQIWLAELDGEAVGAVSIRPEDGDLWDLSTVVVRPLAQGRGIGRAMVRTALAFARARGARRIVLDSNSSLKAAIRLYESLGFIRLARPRGIYETADVAMELDLDGIRSGL